MPYQAEAADVLADWREVQRHLQEVPDGTPEAIALLEEAGQLRREYQSLVTQAVARFRAAPPPFPTTAERDPG